jgi:hypothetical protein
MKITLLERAFHTGMSAHWDVVGTFDSIELARAFAVHKAKKADPRMRKYILSRFVYSITEPLFTNEVIEKILTN